jgi:hypothetical protein
MREWFAVFVVGDGFTTAPVALFADVDDALAWGRDNYPYLYLIRPHPCPLGAEENA